MALASDIESIINPLLAAFSSQLATMVERELINIYVSGEWNEQGIKFTKS